MLNAQNSFVSMYNVSVSNPANLEALIAAVQKGNIESTHSLLMHLKMAAHTVGHMGAMEWASNEAHGYCGDEPLPTYRTVANPRVRATWQNDANLSQVIQKTLDSQALEKFGHNKRLCAVTESIYELEYFVDRDRPIIREWGDAECLAYIRSIESLQNYVGWTLIKVEEVVEPSSISRILGSIKTETIGFALTIKEAYPELTSPDDIANEIRQNVYIAMTHSYNNINFGTIGNLAQGSGFTQDNRGQTLAVTTVAEEIQQKLGITELQAREGAEAMEKDGWKIGKHAKAWATKIVGIAAATGIDLAFPGVLEVLKSIPGIAD